MLLEREQALDAVAELVRSTAAGAGATLLVEGAAGTGKTALLAVARATAARDGLTVLAAASGELEQDLPWGIVRDLLRRTMLTQDGSWPPPVLAAVGVGNGTSPDDLAALPPLTEACAAMARDRAMLLVVDDAHWCDPPSARQCDPAGWNVGRAPAGTPVADQAGGPQRVCGLKPLTRDAVDPPRVGRPPA